VRYTRSVIYTCKSRALVSQPGNSLHRSLVTSYYLNHAAVAAILPGHLRSSPAANWRPRWTRGNVCTARCRGSVRPSVRRTVVRAGGEARGWPPRPPAERRQSSSDDSTPKLHAGNYYSRENATTLPTDRRHARQTHPRSRGMTSSSRDPRLTAATTAASVWASDRDLEKDRTQAIRYKQGKEYASPLAQFKDAGTQTAYRRLTQPRLYMYVQYSTKVKLLESRNLGSVTLPARHYALFASTNKLPYYYDYSYSHMNQCAIMRKHDVFRKKST